MLGKEFMLSVNGHYGKEEARNSTVSATATAGTLREEFTSWSGNVELILPLPYGFWIKGEGFYGSMLGTYYAGIGQSITSVATAGSERLNAVHSWGGWGQLGWVASPSLRFHVGASIDNPRNSDLLPTTVDTNPASSTFGKLLPGGRSLNRIFYANFMYNITPAVLTGYEITHAMTQYNEGPNGDDLRHQVSVMFKF
jgi:hypothetical protein